MDIKKDIENISRGATEVISLEGLEKKLLLSHKENRPLRIKAGFDPTAPDIHLGHVVLLRKLRQFQDMGHQVLFLIGDFTARIGDPTGQDKIRVVLDQKKIQENAQTYKEQVFKILDAKKTEVVFNSAWLDKLTAQEALGLTRHSTVAQMLVRSDFKKRFGQQREISILEFVYPLLQGYDSVHLKADIEVGGADQRFNLLMGRQLQEAYNQEPQIVIMMPLIEGVDGVQKMSKSLGNYIGIDETPDEVFGKLMSINDELMYKYFEFLTDCDLVEMRRLHPKEAKLRLGQAIVSQFHSLQIANNARESFENVFSQRRDPKDVCQYYLKDEKLETIVEILFSAQIVSSKNEARRLCKQGAISCDGKKIDGETWLPRRGVVKIGKRRFLKLV